MRTQITKGRGNGITRVLCDFKEAEREAIRQEIQPHLDAIQKLVSNR